MVIELDTRLRDAPLFRALEPEALDAVRKAATLQRVARGGFFFHEGEPADTLYVLVSGRVKLAQVTPEGSEVLLHFDGPGELFGGVGAPNHTTYSTSAQAVEDSEALAWDTAGVRELMERQPRLALNVLELLTERLHELQNRYRELATQRVEQRLASAVLRLARHCGRVLPGGVLLDMRLSREDLANMTGTTLYTVSRILSRWEQAGLVKSRRERVAARPGRPDRNRRGSAGLRKTLSAPPRCRGPLFAPAQRQHTRFLITYTRNGDTASRRQGTKPPDGGHRSPTIKSQGGKYGVRDYQSVCAGRFLCPRVPRGMHRARAKG